MTRTYTKQPVWVWICDSCGIEHSTLALEQRKLPTPDDMRAAGWYIAPRYGDLCPACSGDRKSPEQEV